MPHIDYFFATFSPWTYFAGDRLERIAAAAGATIDYKPVDLMRVFSRTGGTPLAERPLARREYRLQELARWSKRLGMPLNLQPAFYPVNPAPSSYAIIAAQKAGGGDLGALVRNILRAIWAENRDIADDEVIGACLSAAGFDPKLAMNGLLIGAETYAANTEEAIARGVFGAPFYITDDDERFWGQDRLDLLAEHLGVTI